MKPEYHFISHTHWDREWYKTFETFRLDVVDMINSLFEIFENNPDFKYFTMDGQTIILEDYLEINPENINKLKQYIQSGKISIGPWYILPDEFLVSGESTIRNLLVGKKVGEKYGGQVMNVGYIPDSFGHIAMMPAILKGFDMDTAVNYRGFGGEQGQEKSEYWWQAPDGSKVLMIHLPPNGYGDAYIGTNSEEVFIKKGNQLKEILDPRATTPFRLCMNGGDHHFPEPYLPEALKTMSDKCEGKFIHSNLPDYINAVKKYVEENQISLKEIKGELKWGYRYAFAVTSGVYSSRMYLKQANYQCETLLTRYTEPLAIWASLAGRENLFPMNAQGWKNLLQNHPHDSICGCSIDEVHSEMESRFAKCQQIGETVIDKSIKHFYPDAYKGSENIFVFNPQTRISNQLVSISIEFFRQKVIVGLNPNVHPDPKEPLVTGFKITDSMGEELPYQILKHYPEQFGFRYSDYSYPSKSIVEKFDLLIDPPNIPGLGFSKFNVAPADSFPEYVNSLKYGENYLENDHLRLEILENGSINLVDKKDQKSYDELHIFEDGGDAGDEYNYSYPQEDKVFTSTNCKAKISLIEKGPLRAAIKIETFLEIPADLEKSRKKRSDRNILLPITTKVFLYHNQPRVEFETTIENVSKDHRLRILFPTGLQTTTSYADSQFCITKREHHPINPKEFDIEVPSSVYPMQRGVTVLDDHLGFTVATAGLPEYELKAEELGTIAITLLRCVARLSGNDLLTRPGGDAGWIAEVAEAQCLGKYTFRYAIIPHLKKDFDDYNLVNEQLEAFHLPPKAFRRSGEPHKNFNWCKLNLSPSSLVVSAFKQAEDKNGYILRFYNPTNQNIQSELQLGIELKSANFTQLNEKNLKKITIENKKNISFEAEANKIISIRLIF